MPDGALIQFKVYLNVERNERDTNKCHPTMLVLHYLRVKFNRWTLTDSVRLYDYRRPVHYFGSAIDSSMMNFAKVEKPRHIGLSFKAYVKD